MLGLPLRGETLPHACFRGTDDGTEAWLWSVRCQPRSDLILVLPALPQGAGTEGTASRGEMGGLWEGGNNGGYRDKEGRSKSIDNALQTFWFKTETGELPKVPLPVLLDLEAEMAFRRLFRTTPLAMGIEVAVGTSHRDLVPVEAQPPGLGQLGRVLASRWGGPGTTLLFCAVLRAAAAGSHASPGGAFSLPRSTGRLWTVSTPVQMGWHLMLRSHLARPEKACDF